MARHDPRQALNSPCNLRAFTVSPRRNIETSTQDVAYATAPFCDTPHLEDCLLGCLVKNVQVIEIQHHVDAPSRLCLTARIDARDE